MDFSINKIHDILLDAALPSTIEDLKNPTEDYVVNLLTTFLSRFYININLIDRPISEQYNAMTYYEDSDIINLINLHAVVTQIFDKIFLHDFCLTDITNPGQKRLRKQAKYLSNFVLYTMHKQSGFNDRMEQVQSACRLLEELKEKKAQDMESIKNIIMHKAKQLAMIEKLEKDIQHVQSETEKLNKKESELDTMKNNVKKKYQEVKEICGTVKTAVGKLSKEIAELRSEIVHSPEKYESRLNKLEEQYNLKEENRGTMQEAIQEKKQSIKQIEEILNFVQKMNDEPLTYKYTYKEMKDKKTKSDDVKKQIDSFNNIRNEQQTKLAMHKDQVAIEIKKLQLYHEEDIVPLCNLHSQLLSEKNVQKAKYDGNKTCCNEKYFERNKLNADIKKIEEETTRLLYGWQEIYDNEIANELDLRKIWKEE